jgi:5-methylcytosine-specific restriction protein A
MSPMAPLRACRWPGCPGFAVADGRCAMHRRPPAPALADVFRASDRRRGSAHRRGYGRDWRATRALVLAGEPLCRACQKRGYVTAATEVHHLVRVDEDPARRLDPENLVPLCKRCHVSLTMAEDVRRTRGGRGA